MNIDNYFADNSIDIDSVLQSVCDKLPNSLFCNNRLEIYKIEVPSITDEAKYAAFVFPDTVNPRQMINLFESKTDDCEILYGDRITAQLVSDEEELESVDLVNVPFCRHGNMYLLDRKDLPYTLYIKIVSVRRIPDSMMDDVLLPIKNIYYAALTRNTELGYQSMNYLSSAVANHVSSNQNVLPLMMHDQEEEESYLL